MADTTFQMPEDNVTVLPSGEGIVIIDTGDQGIEFNDFLKATVIPDDDGGVDIELSPKGSERNGVIGDASDHGANLADHLDDSTLALIASDLLDAIAEDERSMADYLEDRKKGIELLGFKMESPRSSPGAGDGMGMSVVRNPALAEAVVRFQSNAAAELYPAEGPVKIRNDSPPPPETEVANQVRDVPAGMGAPKPPTQADLAEALEKDMNHFLTSIDKGYRPDSVRMLFWVGFGGCGFKKVWNDPLRRMPQSRAVDVEDMIISNSANDLTDCGRVTHRIKMRPSVLKRMQIAKAYRDVYISHAVQEQPNPITEAKNSIAGIEISLRRPEDQEHTVFEVYCELDLHGFEHRDEHGEKTGLPLPYRVAIEKDSRQVLEIRRNWREGDENFEQKRVFVKFPFIPAIGFFEIGLFHLLGNSTRALTAAWREALDAGMYASFPGFLYSELGAKEKTNQFRVPPGGAAKINTGGKPIQEVVMSLPYKDASPSLLMLTEKIEESARRIGGTAELQVAEGRQDAPVGTTLAMIEQATKMLAAVHINLHAAQAEEFQLLKECFKEDPQSLWRFNKKPARQWEVDEFLQALEDYDLVPQADPNTPSRMHRIMKAMAIKQLQGMSPQLYDAAAVDAYVLRIVGVSDPYTLFASKQAQAQAGQPQPDPAKMADIQMKAQAAQTTAGIKAQAAQAQAQAKEGEMAVKRDKIAADTRDAELDRQSKAIIEARKEETERLKVAAAAIQSGLGSPAMAHSVVSGQPMPPPGMGPSNGFPQ